MPEMMYSGCICCYSACDFDNILVLCKGGGTCICIEQNCCIAANVEQFPVGMIKQDGFIAKCALPSSTATRYS